MTRMPTLHNKEEISRPSFSGATRQLDWQQDGLLKKECWTRLALINMTHHRPHDDIRVPQQQTFWRTEKNRFGTKASPTPCLLSFRFLRLLIRTHHLAVSRSTQSPGYRTILILERYSLDIFRDLAGIISSLAVLHLLLVLYISCLFEYGICSEAKSLTDR